MFNEWLLEQLKDMDWSQADLARVSGLTRPAISNYINGRTPDEAALRKIARAFKTSPETVFRAAGILPPQVEDPWLHEITYKASQLKGSRRDMAARLLDTLLDQQEEEEQAARRPARRPRNAQD
jgi:transcriptional regulator with XRE-family HTH domain